MSQKSNSRLQPYRHGTLAESAAPVAKDLIDAVPSRTLLMTHAHLEFDVYTPAPSEIRLQPSACSSVYSLQRAGGGTAVLIVVGGNDGAAVRCRVLSAQSDQCVVCNFHTQTHRLAGLKHATIDSQHKGMVQQQSAKTAQTQPGQAGGNQ